MVSAPRLAAFLAVLAPIAMGSGAGNPGCGGGPDPTSTSARWEELVRVAPGQRVERALRLRIAGTGGKGTTTKLLCAAPLQGGLASAGRVTSTFVRTGSTSVRRFDVSRESSLYNEQSLSCSGDCEEKFTGRRWGVTV
jgi:hypothetical protein